MAKVLMKGNEAIAEAAIKAGCTHFFGYPITPQNQIPEYMSKRMPQVGGTFIQAESEVSAINMVYGAAGAGAGDDVLIFAGDQFKAGGDQLYRMRAASLSDRKYYSFRAGLGGILPSQGDYFQ